MNQKEHSRNTRPALHMVGNAHLDPAWMWQWGEGMEAFLATCRSALDRMDETPGFIFTCSSAAHYRWVEEVEPELFERIRSRVASGEWSIAGGWWVQADCNLPSGEGFARQALLGQRYFLEKFGRTARTGYSPDAFGHNLGLPQLLARAGMNAYIYCRPDPSELQLPSPLLRWAGPDGSSVLAYRVPFHYNMYESSVPKKTADLLAAAEAPSALAPAPLMELGPEWMLFYGVGNHGGGPTREHIEQIIAIDSSPDGPRLLFSNPDRYFAEAERQPEAFNIPAWATDFQLNSPGCYTAHSGIKRLNRRSEHELAVAERYSSLASILLGAPYPAAELRRGWESVCFNHFHDIICGVAIREALEDATAMYGEALAAASRATRYALQRVARRIDTRGEGLTLLVFNSHSWNVELPVTFELWHDIDKALWSQPVPFRMTDDADHELPCQLGYTSGKIGRDRIAVTFMATVPALGWHCYRAHYGEAPALDVAPVAARDTWLENRGLRVEIDPESGALARIYHKVAGRELLAGPGGLPVAIEDDTDTWGHGRERFDQVLGKFGQAEVRLVEQGPLHATIRARSRWGRSWVQHDYRLYHDAEDLHVETRIFWGEERTMLKLLFGVNLRDPRAFYESAYCVTEKPCDGIERPGGTWGAIVGDAGDEPFGLGVATNAKYGYSATEPGTLAITALRSPSFATHDPHPHDPNEDLEFLDQGVQRFRMVLHPITTSGWRTEMFRIAALLNAPPEPKLESAHEPGGIELGRVYHGIEIRPGNVMATVVKRSEDATGWIVRLFETEGIRTEAEMTLHPLGRSWRGELGPHEVTTLLIRGDEVRQVNLAEL